MLYVTSGGNQLQTRVKGNQTCVEIGKGGNPVPNSCVTIAQFLVHCGFRQSLALSVPEHLVMKENGKYKSFSL